MYEVAPELLRVVLTAGLSGEEPRPVAVDHSDWDQALPVLVAKRLSGLAAWAIDCGTIRIDADQQSEVFAHRDAKRSRATTIRAASAAAIDDLARHGFSAYPIKGVAYDGTIYPHGVRQYVDADLVVEQHRFGDALESLLDTGYQRHIPSRHVLEIEFGGGIGLSGPLGQIDLHRVPVASPLGERVTDEFFTAARTSTPAALSGEFLAVHACLSLLVGDRNPRPIQFRDVIQTVRAAGADAVLDAASLVGVTGLVVVAEQLASEAFGVKSQLDHVKIEPPWLDALIVRSRRQSRFSSALLQFALADGWKGRGRFLDYMLGSAEWAEYTGRRMPALLRRALEGSRPTT